MECPNGLRFGFRASTDGSPTSVTPQALKLTSANPDAIVVVASGSGAAMPQLGLVERGYKGKLYQTHAAATQDLMRIGGVSGWLRAAPIASALGVAVSTHLYPEVCAHLMRVTETAHWLEWQDWANPVLAEPFEVRDSRIVVPDRPGCGIEWDEKAVRRHAYDA